MAKSLKDLLNPKDTWLDKLEQKFITTPPTPACAEMDEWDYIREKQRANHPIAVALFQDFPCYLHVKQRIIGDFFWAFKYRFQTKHKYHLIDTKLKPGYYDYDTRMLNGTFSLFVEFIEEHNRWGSSIQKEITMYSRYMNEKNWSDWERKESKKYKKQLLDGYSKRLEMWRTFKELYLWWTLGRKEEHDKLEKESDAFYASDRVGRREVRNLKKSDPLYKKYEQQMKKSYELFLKEDKLKEKDTEMLSKLVKYNPHLWV